MLTSVRYLRGISYPNILQWVVRITKKELQAQFHPEDLFLVVTPMPKYGQRSTFLKRLYNIVPLKAKTIDQHPESLHSTSCGTGEHLRATAPSTTQRSLNSTLRACTAPHEALETEHTIRPSRTTQKPINSALKACKAGEHHGTPYYTTIERPLNSTLRASKSPNVVHWRHL